MAMLLRWSPGHSRCGLPMVGGVSEQSFTSQIDLSRITLLAKTLSVVLSRSLPRFLQDRAGQCGLETIVVLYLEAN
jgi:hypothetical protein